MTRLALVLNLALAGAAAAPHATTADVSEITEQLQAMASSSAGGRPSDGNAPAAAERFLKGCSTPLQNSAGVEGMLKAYAAALSALPAAVSAAQIDLLLRARHSVWHTIVDAAHGPCEAIPTGLEPLGLCGLFAEGHAYALAPCNAFLRVPIAKALPARDRDFLAAEEAYFGAFQGEYLSAADLTAFITKGEQFLKRYPTGPRSDTVRCLVDHGKVNLKASKAEGEGALNDGPRWRCD